MTIVKNFCSYNPYKSVVILVKKTFYDLNTSTTEMYNCIGILSKIYIFIASHMAVQHHSLFIRTARCPESVYLDRKKFKTPLEVLDLAFRMILCITNKFSFSEHREGQNFLSKW